MPDRQTQFLQYLSGELSSAEWDDLRAWMREHPANAAELAKLALLELHLREKSAFDRLMEASAPSSPVAGTPPVANKSPRQRLVDRAIQFVTRPTPFSITVAAVALAVVLTTMALLVPRLQRAVVREENPTGRPSQEVVADVTGVFHAVWADGQRKFFKGSRLSSGQQLDLKSGLVEVTYRNGARTIVEGPALFGVDSTGSGSLQRGKLTASVPPEAVGFSVQTAFLNVVDLGTEFSIDAQSTGDVDVAVHKGTVQVEPVTENPSPIRLAAGQAMQFPTGRLPQWFPACCCLPDSAWSS